MAQFDSIVSQNQWIFHRAQKSLSTISTRDYGTFGDASVELIRTRRAMWKVRDASPQLLMTELAIIDQTAQSPMFVDWLNKSFSRKPLSGHTHGAAAEAALAEIYVRQFENSTRPQRGFNSRRVSPDAGVHALRNAARHRCEVFTVLRELHNRATRLPENPSQEQISAAAIATLKAVGLDRYSIYMKNNMHEGHLVQNVAKTIAAVVSVEATRREDAQRATDEPAIDVAVAEQVAVSEARALTAEIERVIKPSLRPSFGDGIIIG